jgi:hypothetical protein
MIVALAGTATHSTAPWFIAVPILVIAFGLRAWRWQRRRGSGRQAAAAAILLTGKVEPTCTGCEGRARHVPDHVVGQGLSRPLARHRRRSGDGYVPHPAGDPPKGAL